MALLHNEDIIFPWLSMQDEKVLPLKHVRYVILVKYLPHSTWTVPEVDTNSIWVILEEDYLPNSIE